MLKSTNIKKDEDENFEKLYLKKLGNHSLLTFEEEIALARRAKHGDKKAREELVERNLRLVLSVAKKYKSSDFSLFDLIQEGTLGLIKAVDKYDPEKGFRFSTYATWWIKQSISRALIDKSKVIRLPVHFVERMDKFNKITNDLKRLLGRSPNIEEIASVMNLDTVTLQKFLSKNLMVSSLDSLVSSSEEDNDLSLSNVLENTEENTEKTLETNELKNELSNLLMMLTPKERKVILLRYGFLDGKKRKLEEIGKYLQVSNRSVSNLEKKALKKLKELGDKKSLEPYLYN